MAIGATFGGGIGAGSWGRITKNFVNLWKKLTPLLRVNFFGLENGAKEPQSEGDHLRVSQARF